MDFTFTDEHRALRSMVRDFAQDRIAPHAEDWDRDHYFPTDVVKEMGLLSDDDLDRYHSSRRSDR